MTKIAPLSDAAIIAALLREQRRHGQSFLICPRIQDLEPMLARVQSAAPDLRIVCLHGRLPADEIDDRMMTFVEGEADVLLATNIVESGLDIPRANTIVVCWPEKFGLAQLHQLRGRVGRGGIRAFAYLLTEAKSEHSEKRLAVLEEFSKPGAGFAISERDLDLRGAGRPLLGTAVRPCTGFRTGALQPSSEAGFGEGDRRGRRSVGAGSESAGRGYAARELRAVGGGSAGVYGRVAGVAAKTIWRI